MKYEPPLCGLYKSKIKFGYLPGFAKAAVVSRFLARYRLARAFRGLELEGYSSETLAGYNALTKISLHWSAFEQFKKALNIKHTNKLIDTYPIAECINQIADFDPEFKFFSFVRDHLTHQGQINELNIFISSRVGSPLALSKAIRHIFFHGPLTPNASGVNPMAVKEICDCLSAFIVTFIDSEFKKSVEDLELFFPEYPEPIIPDYF